MALPPAAWALVVGSGLAAVSTYPFVATAIAYRRRDNGLSYILMVLGVGVWNGMFVAQLLSNQPLVQTFFLSLAIVGGLLGGLGWFLFAGTASSTPFVPNERVVYGGAAVLVGLDVALAVTAPVHSFYWVPATGSPSSFVVIAPRLGYWLHTQLMFLLFAGGTYLFARAWREGQSVEYARAYTIAGSATVFAILASNVFTPGGLSIGPVMAVSLTAIGWVQARRGRVLGGLRDYLARSRIRSRLP